MEALNLDGSLIYSNKKGIAERPFRQFLNHIIQELWQKKVFFLNTLKYTSNKSNNYFENGNINGILRILLLWRKYFPLPITTNRYPASPPPSISISLALTVFLGFSPCLITKNAIKSYVFPSYQSISRSCLWRLNHCNQTLEFNYNDPEISIIIVSFYFVLQKYDEEICYVCNHYLF